MTGHHVPRLRLACAVEKRLVIGAAFRVASVRSDASFGALRRISQGANRRLRTGPALSPARRRT
ncbi:hypothetical protein [Streptomyces avermitilis]|uniref:hypothetical protein n=1 Tax=Streptomyces avermitilis TaxID=33903 RepID=UPI0033BE6F18